MGFPLALMYGMFSASILAITSLCIQREIDTQKDFKKKKGSLDIYHYYKHLKRRSVKLSTTFQMFLLALLNMCLSTIIGIIFCFV